MLSLNSITGAPDGKETVVVLLPIGHIAPNNENSMDDFVKIARAKVIKIMEMRLKITNFEELIETEVINDPRTWQSKFNLWKGSILGLSHSIFQVQWQFHIKKTLFHFYFDSNPQVLFFRPGTRSHLFKNLYFVGASTHPGTGVPIVLSGAKLVAKQILEDVGLIERKDNKSTIFFHYFLFVLFLFLFVYLIMKLF